MSRWHWRIVRIAVVMPIVCLVVWWLFFALPSPLFDAPYSTILLDREGQLLGARIAADEQWRFPEIDSVPQHFAEALLCFEDKRFYRHTGVDVLALGRAAVTNIRARRVVSGGSTLTMQLMRMARGGRGRTFGQKIVEIATAWRAEMRYPKENILRMYVSHAPYGGNVVGLEAASWRYFGKAPSLLSWGEAACLAVLPNSPALIHPGRGRALLKSKRDRLLTDMYRKGIIDSMTAHLAILEPLPDAPHPLPDLAPHLLGQLRRKTGMRLRSTVDARLQHEVINILQHHHTVLAQNGIRNGAVLVMDTGTGEVLAYAGNVADAEFKHHNAVDMVRAARSSGSILKPFLYASAFDEGLLLPEMLTEDVPVTLRGYRPENFTRSYTGMVPAGEALMRSLNVPAVLLLRDYGIERFRRDLVAAGLTTIRYSAEHYGLPLILGGAEVSLWDLCGVYASMGRMLNHAYRFDHRYDHADLHAPVAISNGETIAKGVLRDEPALWSYGSLWQTFEAMRQLSRPDEEGQWENFQSQKRVAWKTGTSYGFRDAWAVGVTPQYTVGVWIGNASGEGRPGILGVRAAAPVMFDVLRLLPGGDTWWTQPHDDMAEMEICAASGYPAGRDCPQRNMRVIARGKKATPVCPFHIRIYTDADERYRYHHECAGNIDIHAVAWFVLPPAAEYYYARARPGYRALPPLHPSCEAPQRQGVANMQLVYPSQHARIYIPRDLDGSPGNAVFKAAHRNRSSTVYWYLGADFLGSTTEFHTLPLRPPPGTHRVVLVDDSGERLERVFAVVSE